MALEKKKECGENQVKLVESAVSRLRMTISILIHVCVDSADMIQTEAVHIRVSGEKRREAR